MLDSKRVTPYLIITGIILLLNYFNLFLPLENRLDDLLLISRYLVTPPRVDNLALVVIDDSSLQELGQWPISRYYYGQAIEILEEEGAGVIGLDIILSDPSEQNTDRDLARLLAKYDNIVLPVVAKIHLKRALHNDDITVTGINRPLKIFADQVELGHINFVPDRDGIIRSLPIYFKDGKVSYPSFSLKLAEMYLGRELKYKNESIMLSFAGPAGTIPHLSFSDLLSGNFSNGFFRDKLVIIGTAITGVGDRYMTPFSRYGYLNGVEINGQAVLSLLNNDYFYNLSFFSNFLIILLTALIQIMIFSRVSAKKSAYLVILSITLYCVLNLVIFYYYRLNYHLLTPVITIIILYGFSLLRWYLFSEKEKRYLVDTFSPYLSGELIDELLKKPDSVKLGGERITVSVLFIDIRDFTTYAENRSPEEVVVNLNRTFTAISRIIFKYKGTLDKYLGDGVMAFFGAPVPVADHSRKALLAAREIQKLAMKGELPFRLGAGINSGPVLVGNIGSKERMDYTVIGDVVNKAALFVELAKAGEIIVGESTYVSLPEFIKGYGWIKEQRFLKGINKDLVYYRLNEGE
ncbi:MAG: adenylate cyclase [Halanaerobiales bacterium]|nr:adenylate cyclase [Halanaerobiales bacterium]